VWSEVVQTIISQAITFLRRPAGHRSPNRPA